MRIYSFGLCRRSFLTKMLSRRLTAAIGSESMDRLPLELLELLLLRTFVKLFTDHYKSQFNVRRVSVQRSYSALAAVCYNWWQTMNGWPQSPTGHWFRHKLHRFIKSLMADTSHRPHFSHPNKQLTTTTTVQGVTRCGDRLYIVCENSEEIVVVDAKDVSRHFSSIKVPGLHAVNDIVACTESRHLYLADVADGGCVWRVSTNGRRVEKWKDPESAEFNESLHSMLHKICWSLSIRSRRLLVTTNYWVLVLYGPDDCVLRKVTVDCLEEDTTSVQHAVETLRQTFLVLLVGSEPEAPAGIVEVNSDGRHIRFFCDRKLLDVPLYIALDSNDRVFVADYTAPRVLLLTDRLELEHTVDVGACLKDENNWVLSAMTYVEHPFGGRLIVGGLLLICLHDLMCSRGEKSRKQFPTDGQKCVVM